MSHTLSYRPMGTSDRSQTHTLFAQIMGYVAATAALFAAGVGWAVTWPALWASPRLSLTWRPSPRVLRLEDADAAKPAYPDGRR